MGKKVKRVRYSLDSKDVKKLPLDEIAAILRAAEELIMIGGRTMLVKILKGSKAKKVLELNLDKCPAYGFYQNLSVDDILARIDWVIINRYLAIEYDYRLPLLVYTPRGWEIEKETYSDELLRSFDEMLESGSELFNMRYLKDKNRGLILLLLQKTEDSKYIPLLEAWEKIDYKKVVKRIRQVITFIQQKDHLKPHIIKQMKNL